MPNSIPLFDGYCTLGRPRVAATPYFADARAILAHLRKYGIRKALVAHIVAEENDPATGNRRLTRDLKGYPELIPLWTALPPHTGEISAPAAFLSEMRAAGTRAFRLLPRTQQFRLSDCAELLQAAAEQKSVLFLKLAETSWSEVEHLCQSHPTLDVVVTHVGYREDRQLYPRLEAHPHLHIALMRYQVNGGISQLVKRFGPDRLLWASDAPVLTTGQALGQLCAADLDPQARRLIGGGNLARLLDLKWPEEESIEVKDRDPFVRAYRASRKLPAGIVDAHGHLGPYFHFHAGFNSAEEMVADMDRLGIETIALSHMQAIASDWIEGNRLAAQAARAFPGRILGYAVANPHEESKIAGELKRAFAQGCRAIKLHPALHLYPVNGPAYHPAFEFAARRGVPVLTHTAYECLYTSPEKTADAARKFPDVPVIFGHAGDGSIRGARCCLSVAGKLPNAYFELCSSTSQPGALELLVREVGAERVLYGSDAPFIDWGAQLGKVIFADLKESERRAILGGNAKRLFKLKKRFKA